MQPPTEKRNVIWKANRGGQWLYLASPHYQVMCSGSRGSGKTDALLFSYLKHVGKGWGEDWRGVIFRRTYPQLRDIIGRSTRWIPRIFPGSKYNKTERLWRFPDGETLLFTYMNSLSDYQQMHGSSFTFIGWEELTLWPTSECYEAMVSCLRSDRKGIPLLIRANTNSWGPGFQWCKARFVDFGDPFKPVGEPGRERMHIPLNWEENIPFREADPDYHVRLAEEITNQSQLRSWLHGSWDIVAGGYFADVWRDAIHYIEPFDIPPGWHIDRAHDWGSSAPFCTLWFAESNGEALPDGRRWPKGTLFVINEDYGCAGDPDKPNWKPNVGLELQPVDIASRVKSVEQRMLLTDFIKKKPLPGPGDDPLWDLSRGQSIGKQMADAGVLWSRPSKGPGSRVAGWLAIAQRLKAAHEQPMEKPGLFVFQTCKHLHRTLPSLPRDDKKPDDIQTDSEDHCLHGDTIVITEHGKKRIRDIVGSSGRVLTLAGWQDYYNCRMTQSNQECIKVVFSDGQEIICTMDHRLLTVDGWRIPLSISDALSYNILKEEHQLWKPKLSARLFRNLMTLDITNADLTSNAKGSGSIAWSTNITLAQSQKDHTFTTWMETGATIQSQILPSCLAPPIYHCMQGQETPTKSAIMHGNARLYGTKAKTADHGISSILRKQHEALGSGKSLKHANTVAKTIKHNNIQPGSQDSVQGDANRDSIKNKAICILQKHVQYVPYPSKPVSMTVDLDATHVPEKHQLEKGLKTGCLQNLHIKSIEPAGKHDVYCLTVPTVGHFIVESGLIVKNCADALRLRCLKTMRGNVVHPVDF